MHNSLNKYFYILGTFTYLILNCLWNKLDIRRKNKNKPLGYCCKKENLHEYSLKISKLRNENVHPKFDQKMNVVRVFQVIYYTNFIKII